MKTARRNLVAALLDAKAVTEEDLDSSAASWGGREMTKTPGTRLLKAIEVFAADWVEASCKEAASGGCRKKS
jgi:hypothetical protein